MIYLRKLIERPYITIYCDATDNSTLYYKRKSRSVVSHDIFVRTGNCQLYIIKSFNHFFYLIENELRTECSIDEVLGILQELVKKLSINMIYVSLLKDYDYLDVFTKEIDKYFKVISITDFIDTNECVQKHFLLQNKFDYYSQSSEYFIYHDNAFYNIQDNRSYFDRLMSGNALKKELIKRKYNFVEDKALKDVSHILENLDSLNVVLSKLKKV